MRVENWQTAFVEVLEHYARQSFGWGTADCMQLALANVAAVTGTTPYPKAKGYKTEKGALRVLKRHGFDTPEQAIEAAFDEIHVAAAGRADLGVFDAETGVAVVVCTGVCFVGLAPDSGYIEIRRAAVRRAFRVE